MRQGRKGRNNRAGVLWTGGKDCALALLLGKDLGYEICNLVTFNSKGGSDWAHLHRYQSHPLEHMEVQSELMGIRHLVLDVELPFRRGYERAIGFLREEHGLDTLITGDIDGCGNWVQECSRYSGMRVENPLWKRDREEVLGWILERGLEVFISWVKEPWFRDGSWIGGLDGGVIERLKRFGKEGSKGGNKDGNFDLCGEKGEYHTLVLDGPMFLKGRIGFSDYSVVREAGVHYIEIKGYEVYPKRFGL